jgi:ADP-heptose:LPS heptosyltransferase
MGDVLLSTPLLRALRLAYPQAQLDYLTTAPCAQMLLGNPHLDRVLAYPRHDRPWMYLQVARALRREQYDVVIDLEGARSPARLTWATRAPTRIGYDSSATRWAYTHRVPEQDNRRYWVLAQAELLRPLGIAVDSIRAELFLNEWDRARAARILAPLGLAAGDAFAALTPGSAAAHNLWPADRYAQVADHLAARWGLRTVLLYGPGQEGIVRAVREAVREPEACVIAVTPTMREAAAVVERSRLYVGSDTGTRHLAIALDVPTVGVFGRQFPERWTPPQAAAHLAAAYDPGCKDHCYYRTCEHVQCIRGIPVSAVLDKVDALLNLPAAGRSPAAGASSPSAGP